MHQSAPSRRDLDLLDGVLRPAHAQDPAHDDRRADEQQDDGQDHVDDLLGHVGLERHLRLPGAHDAEQQRGGDGQQRLHPGEQGDGDAVEPEADVEPGLVAVEHALGLDGPAEAGEEAADAPSPAR